MTTLPFRAGFDLLPRASLSLLSLPKRRFRGPHIWIVIETDFTVDTRMVFASLGHFRSQQSNCCAASFIRKPICPRHNVCLTCASKCVAAVVFAIQRDVFYAQGGGRRPCDGLRPDHRGGGFRGDVRGQLFGALVPYRLLLEQGDWR